MLPSRSHGSHDPVAPLDCSRKLVRIRFRWIHMQWGVCPINDTMRNRSQLQSMYESRGRLVERAFDVQRCVHACHCLVAHRITYHNSTFIFISGDSNTRHAHVSVVNASMVAGSIPPCSVQSNHIVMLSYVLLTPADSIR